MLSGGTAFTQALGVLLAPIITRIYSPGEFGVLSLYMSIMSVLVVFASFYYESAIPIAENDEKAINVLSLCFSILIILVLVISVILVLFGEQLFNIMKVQELLKYRYLIPAGVFLAGSYNIFIKWNLRKKSFKNIFISKISQSISGNLTKIILGILNFGSIGLILGNILNQSAGVSLLSIDILKNKQNLLQKVTIKEMQWSAKRYVNFFNFSLPNAFILSFTIQMPIFFLTSIYGREEAGFFGLANTITKLPTILIGNSIGEVFYAEVASLGKKNVAKIIALSNNLFKKLIILGIVPLIILLIWAPQLFSIIFGSNWYIAGLYSRMLSISVFSNLIFHPISRIYGVFERQKLKLIIDFIRFIFILLFFIFAGYVRIKPLYIVFIYSLFTFIFYFATFVYAQKIMKEVLIKQQVVE
jgi:O-antigen/teichoic acid export membrane protein